MVLGLTAGELKDLARFMQALENEKDHYGPELTGSVRVRLAGQEWGVGLLYDRRDDGTYEVFVARDTPKAEYILNPCDS
jgi:hypothetical protein